jgi:transcription elongation factor Elf1
MSDWDDDDDKPKVAPGKKQFFEFDCPECSANNPWPDGFKAKDDVTCHYCGISWEVRVSSEGRMTLKQI